MFSGTIHDTAAFQSLLMGETVFVVDFDENADYRCDLLSFENGGIPENGNHWMFLNGEKFLVCVEGENSDPEGCPCCAWGWISFRILC